jgi:hypothetical protein
MSLRKKTKPTKPLRLTRRKLLAGVAGLLLSSPFTRFVHAETAAPKHDQFTHWNMLVDHVRDSDPFDRNLADEFIRSWIAKLVHTPEERTSAIVLVGPHCSGKTTFHQALGTLVAPKDYIRGASFHKLLGDAATEANPSLVVWDGGDRRPMTTDRTIHNRLTVPELKFGRKDGTASPSMANRMHWIECWSCNPLVDSSTTKIMLSRLDRPMPQRELFRRLADEKDAFMQHLATFAAPAMPLVSL